MTFKDWHQYFSRNTGHFDSLQWPAAPELSEAELKIVWHSLQQFQRGENSEGRSLYKYAKGFQNDDYLHAFRLFIKEEQNHAAVLGRYMDIHSIPRIRSHWVDNVFRSLRKLASLENSVLVLLTAEIIAAVYYIALRNATRSQTLWGICNRILLDETMHINFQSYTLHRFYRKKSIAGQLYIRLFHRLLMTGTTAVVWMTHKRVLVAGGFSFRRFYREVFTEFDRAGAMIKGTEDVPSFTYA